MYDSIMRYSAQQITHRAWIPIAQRTDEIIPWRIQARGTKDEKCRISGNEALAGCAGFPRRCPTDARKWTEGR